MAIDLKKLEAKFDAVLKTETEESFREWLSNKRKNMTQQTAVQMMLEYLQKHGFDMEYEMELSFLEWEKEQIGKAWNDGNYAYFYSKETGVDFDNGEQYYNETYGK